MTSMAALVERKMKNYCVKQTNCYVSWFISRFAP